MYGETILSKILHEYFKLKLKSDVYLCMNLINNFFYMYLDVLICLNKKDV